MRVRSLGRDSRLGEERGLAGCRREAGPATRPTRTHGVPKAWGCCRTRGAGRARKGDGVVQSVLGGLLPLVFEGREHDRVALRRRTPWKKSGRPLLRRGVACVGSGCSGRWRGPEAPSRNPPHERPRRASRDGRTRQRFQRDRASRALRAQPPRLDAHFRQRGRGRTGRAGGAGRAIVERARRARRFRGGDALGRGGDRVVDQRRQAEAQGRAAHHAARRLAQPRQPALDRFQAGLRSRQLRRVQHDRGRQARVRLPAARRRRARQGRAHGGRAATGRRVVRRAARLLREGRLDVRLLHAGLRHGDHALPGEPSQGGPRAHQGGLRRQLVPPRRSPSARRRSRPRRSSMASSRRWRSRSRMPAVPSGARARRSRCSTRTSNASTDLSRFLDARSTRTMCARRAWLGRGCCWLRSPR